MSTNDEPRYEHTQVGYVTIGAGLFGLLIVGYGINADGKGIGVGSSIAAGAMGLLTVLFSTLTVKVTQDELIFYFGPGFWTKRFPLDDILSADVVRTSPLAGWGIRYTFHGWLYNVSGLQAVELEIQGEGTIRIGTDEPEALKRALDAAMVPV